MNNNDPIKILNELLEYLHDSHDGYKECAKEVADKRFTVIFEKLVSNRSRMISILQLEVKRLGGEPVKVGTTIGAGHRLYVDLKSLLTGGDTVAIVKEVNNGENWLIEKYKLALGKILQPQLNQILRNHLQEIEDNLHLVNEVCKTTEKQS